MYPAHESAFATDPGEVGSSSPRSDRKNSTTALLPIRSPTCRTTEGELFEVPAPQRAPGSLAAGRHEFAAFCAVSSLVAIIHRGLSPPRGGLPMLQPLMLLLLLPQSTRRGHHHRAPQCHGRTVSTKTKTSDSPRLAPIQSQHRPLQQEGLPPSAFQSCEPAAH